MPYSDHRYDLPQALHDAGLDIDCLLIIAGPEHARHFSVYGSDHTVWLLSDVSHTQSDASADQLIGASANYQGLTKGGLLPTLLVGNEQAYSGKSQKLHQFEMLKKRYAQFSKLRPDYLGWVNVTAEAKEAPIPVSMLQDLARRILV